MTRVAISGPVEGDMTTLDYLLVDTERQGISRIGVAELPHVGGDGNDIRLADVVATSGRHFITTERFLLRSPHEDLPHDR